VGQEEVCPRPSFSSSLFITPDKEVHSSQKKLSRLLEVEEKEGAGIASLAPALNVVNFAALEPHFD
jgi:hypothetical protein